MRSHPLRRLSVAVLAAGLVLTGCSGDAEDETTPGPTGPKGELTLLSQGPVASWDPQRITGRQTAGIAGRLWMRTLTSYTPAADTAGQRRIVGDLASTTGEASEDLRRWTFPLRDGVRWQDGSPVTCADVRYGVARSFEPDTGSSGYALAYLDIPKEPDGTSTYPGPYGSAGRSAEARRLIERAVRCDGDEVTFVLGEPVADFNEIVSLPEFAPYKQSQDERDGSAHLAYSSGPYRLEEGWTPSTGGTWVRNEEWSDVSDPVRAAGPERIVHREGIEPEDALDAVGSSEGSRSLMLDPLPPALDDTRRDLGEEVRSVTGDGQLVEYLAPDVEGDVFDERAVRVALATATDRRAYSDALGGDTTGVPTWSLLPTVLPSAHETVLDAGPSGDPERAEKVLADADVDTPVRARIAYRSSGEAMDTAMQRLRDGWQAAGFEITLVPVEDDDYFTAVSRRSTSGQRDATWANWGPDYPSAATVLPALFDNRINLTPESTGRDYGRVSDQRLNTAMDRAARTENDRERAEAWGSVDTDLLEDGAYVPLRQTRLTYVAGPEVTSLAPNAAYGGVPDLGAVGVAR